MWQCRYQVNRRWQRASTGEHELPKAIEKAKKMYIMAEIRHSQGLPVVTRRVKHVAELAIKRMEDEIAIGQGKVSYETYIRIINDFILPTIGKREITSITLIVIDQLDKKRIEIMGKAPIKSTMRKHNAATTSLRTMLERAEQLRVQHRKAKISSMLCVRRKLNASAKENRVSPMSLA